LNVAQAIRAKKKIAIACQGGGSQTAFTAGALKALCEERIADEFEIVSMSGTSGGPCAPCSSGTHLSAAMIRRGGN
jgi:predicted acylesterase/phospholipase RssA